MAYIRKETVTCAVLLTIVVFLSQVGITCAFNSCYAHDDCTSYYGKKRYCCKKYYNACSYSCVGDSCNSDDDCAPDECCDATKETCRKTSKCDSLNEAKWVIPVIIAASVVGALLLFSFVFSLCRRLTRGSARAGAVVRQQAALGTTVIAASEQQQAYLGQQNLAMYPQSQQQQYPDQTSVSIPPKPGENQY